MDQAKVQVLGKPSKAEDNPNAGAADKSQMFEVFMPVNNLQDQFLQKLTEEIIFLVRGFKSRQLYFYQFLHNDSTKRFNLLIPKWRAYLLILFLSSCPRFCSRKEALK